MKRVNNNLLIYLKKIASKWWTWTTTIALNVLAIAAQIYNPEIDFPQIVYLLIIFLGFLIAGYQVYQDITVQLPREKITPPPYELLPLTFTIDLTNQIPQIEVLIYIINYQSRELNLQSLIITNFYVNNNALDIQGISMYTQDESILPKQSKLVICRKYLIPSEINAIEAAHYDLYPYATFLAIPRANIGNKQIYYDRDINYHTSGKIRMNSATT